MGFICEIGLAGALTMTYNINSGANNPPERACAGAAMIAAAEQGGNVSFKTINEAGQAVPAGTGNVSSLTDDKGLVRFSISTGEGAPKTIQWNNNLPNNATPILERMKMQMAKDMTAAPGGRR